MWDRLAITMGLLLAGSPAVEATPGAAEALAVAQVKGDVRIIAEVTAEDAVAALVDRLRAAGVVDAEPLGTLPLIRMRATAGELETLLATGAVRRVTIDGVVAPSSGPSA